MRRLLFVALLLPFLALSASIAHAQLMAQTNADAGGAEPLTISVSPEFPRPYDTVTITPASTLLMLAESAVTVSANGTVIEQGSGGKSVTTTLGGPGTKTTIRVTVVNNGTTYTKELVIAPAEVALIVESQATTHPFYDGAALVAPAGQIRIVAMPDVRITANGRIPTQNLSYTWKVGDKVLLDKSGIGRSVLIATAPVRYRNADVSVTVATTDGAVAGRATVTVSATNPVMRIYRNDPLLGADFAHALSGTIVMTGDEDTFRAVPYYFATPPSIAWTLNGTASGATPDITVRTADRNAGTALLRAVATGATGESSEGSFTVNFGGKKSSNIFGF